jgi:hypothetical protein
VRGSGGGLSHNVVLLPLGGNGGGGGRGGDSGLLPVNGGEVGVAARHGRQDGGGGQQRTLRLGQR